MGPRPSSPPSLPSEEKLAPETRDAGSRVDDVRLDVLQKPDGEGREGKQEDEERVHLLKQDVESGRGGGGGGAGQGRRTVPGVPGAEESLDEIEIKTLLWMNLPENEEWKVAYKTWQAKDNLFASRVERKRKQSSSLRNEIYQLVGFYSVFQGVLLTAVAQSNFLLCHNWWSAFFLSALASLVTVGGVMQKFESVLSLERTISKEDISRKECVVRVQKLLQERGNFNLRTFGAKRKGPSGDGPNQTHLKLSFALVVIILLLFSALFLASIIRILCDSGLPEPAAAPGGR